MQAGELNTPIRIQYKMKIGTGSFASYEWVDVGNTNVSDKPKTIYAKWEGAFGSRAYIADSVQATHPAEVTIRYRADVTSQCRVLKDGIYYDIISPHCKDQKKQWLVFDVKATVNG